MRKRGRKVSIKLEDGLFNVAGLDGKECANVVPPSSRCKGPRVGTPWGELPLERGGIWELHLLVPSSSFIL